jgi:hypothetical protein
MIPAQLIEEIQSLEKNGYSIDVVEGDGWANAVFHDYPVPAGYCKKSTELLLRIPLSYPNGRPDMFWTDEDLTLIGGGIPRSAEQIELALGKQWRRFSWHPQSWNPGVDSLRTYVEFVNTRLAKGV